MKISSKATPLIVSVINLLIITACFYPGNMSHDSVNQYYQALSNAYMDWHPPVMAFLWSLLLKVWPGPFLYLLLNNGMLLAGLLLIQRHFHQRKNSIFILFLCYLPWIFNFMGVIWKDVAMASALTLVVGLAYTPIFRLRFVAIFLLMAYSASMRHNAWLAILPILVWLIYREVAAKGKLRRAAIVSAISALVVGIVFASTNFVTYSLLKAEKTYPASYMMIDDLAALSLMNQNSLLRGATLQEIANCRRTDTIFFTAMCITESTMPQPLSEKNFNILKDDWLKQISLQPVNYAKFRTVAFGEFLGLRNLTPFYVWHPGIDSNDFGLKQTPNLFNQGAHIYVVAASKLLGVLFLPVFWLLLNMFLLYKRLIVNKEFRENISLETTLLSSSVLYLMGYWFIAPAADFRYVYWSVISTTLAYAIQLVNRRV